MTIEEYAFRNLQSPVTATVVNCERVVLKKSIFYWFVKVKISNVPKLELVENTFSTKVKQDNVWNEATVGKNKEKSKCKHRKAVSWLTYDWIADVIFECHSK